MIDLEKSYMYETTDGRKVMMMPKWKNLNGTKVFIGSVEGQQAVRHWTEDGRVFGDPDGQLNLKGE